MFVYSYLENLEFIAVASDWPADWSVRFSCFVSLLVPDWPSNFGFNCFLFLAGFNFVFCLLLSYWKFSHVNLSPKLTCVQGRRQIEFVSCAVAPAQRFIAKWRILYTSIMRNTRLSATRILLFWGAQRLWPAAFSFVVERLAPLAKKMYCRGNFLPPYEETFWGCFPRWRFSF